MAEDYTQMADALVESAVKQLQTPLPTVGFSGVNLGPVRREVDRVNATRNASAKIIDEEKLRVARASEEQKQASLAEGQAGADKALADQKQAQDIADRRDAAFRLFGLDPSQSLGQQIAEFPAVRAKAEEELLKVRDLQSVSLIDDPLTWAINQLKIGPASAAYNRTADMVNARASGIDEALKWEQAYAAEDVQRIPTISAAQAKAVADQKLAEAKVKSTISDLNLAKYNIDFATKKFTEDMAVATMTKESTALELQQATTQFQAQVHAVQMAETRVQRTLNAAKLLETIGDNKATDRMLLQFDTVMGNPVGTTTRAMWAKYPAKAREEVAAISTGSLGADPYQFVQTTQALRFGPNVNPQTMVLREYLAKKVSTISQLKDLAGITDPNIKQQKIAEILNSQVESDMKNPSTNPSFRALSIDNMVTAGTLKKDSPLGKLLEPLMGKGTVPEDVIISTISNAVTNPAEAGAIAAKYFADNIILRNTLSNYKAAGLRVDTSYMVPYSTLGGTMRLDLTKPADMTKYMLLQKRNAQMEEMNSIMGQRFGETGIR